MEAERWEDVLRVSEDFTDNADDATAQLLTYRARALRVRGLHEASLGVLKQALRFRKRSPVVLRSARYERALSYEAAGRKAQARKEFERVFSEDPRCADVAERPGLGEMG